MQTKISVLINTLNEEKNIRNCLASVKWADETFNSISPAVIVNNYDVYFFIQINIYILINFTN